MRRVVGDGCVDACPLPLPAPGRLGHLVLEADHVQVEIQAVTFHPGQQTVANPGGQQSPHPGCPGRPPVHHNTQTEDRRDQVETQLRSVRDEVLHGRADAVVRATFSQRPGERTFTPKATPHRRHAVQPYPVLPRVGLPLPLRDPVRPVVLITAAGRPTHVMQDDQRKVAASVGTGRLLDGAQLRGHGGEVVVTVDQVGIGRRKAVQCLRAEAAHHHDLDVLPRPGDAARVGINDQ